MNSESSSFTPHRADMQADCLDTLETCRCALQTGRQTCDMLLSHTEIEIGMCFCSTEGEKKLLCAPPVLCDPAILSSLLVASPLSPSFSFSTFTLPASPPTHLAALFFLTPCTPSLTPVCPLFFLSLHICVTLMMSVSATIKTAHSTLTRSFLFGCTTGQHSLALPPQMHNAISEAGRQASKSTNAPLKRS